MNVCRQIAIRFHLRVATDPVLSRIFPPHFGALDERLGNFLAERLGGPKIYSATRGKQSLICRHAHLSISTDEEQRWLRHMDATLVELGIAEPLKSSLNQIFRGIAATLTDPLIPYYDLPLEELAALLSATPGLVEPTKTGRSLLAAAAARWDAPRVQTIVTHGANSVPEVLGRSLYAATNARIDGQEPDGKRVVELLIAAGADLNWHGNVTRSTPLHMAARRGTTELAAVLLRHGADLEKTDSKGQSPLRRAINCGHPKMVAFLLAEGANPEARDDQGRRALDAARSEAVRKLLIG